MDFQEDGVGVFDFFHVWEWWSVVKQGRVYVALDLLVHLDVSAALVF